jgi:hypothetical protein
MVVGHCQEPRLHFLGTNVITAGLDHGILLHLQLEILYLPGAIIEPFVSENHRSTLENGFIIVCGGKVTDPGFSVQI